MVYQEWGDLCQLKTIESLHNNISRDKDQFTDSSDE